MCHPPQPAHESAYNNLYTTLTLLKTNHRAMDHCQKTPQVSSEKVRSDTLNP